VSMSPTPPRALPAGLAPAAQVLQEIGHPKKATHANGMFLKGVPTMSNSNILGRLVVYGKQSNH
jgi:hypothetical protein